MPDGSHPESGERLAAVEVIRRELAKGVKQTEPEIAPYLHAAREIEHALQRSGLLPGGGKEPRCTCGSLAVIDAARHDEACWRRLWIERHEPASRVLTREALESLRDKIAHDLFVDAPISVSGAKPMMGEADELAHFFIERLRSFLDTDRRAR